MDKNIILYGPPGTGKTYSAIQYAIAIIKGVDLQEIKKQNYENVLKEYTQYKKEGLIEFITFHQSFSYEEFIEGIRPLINPEDEDSDEIKYELHSGLFKKFCEKALIPVQADDNEGVDLGINSNPKVWKVSLGGTGDKEIRADCIEHNHIRVDHTLIGKDDYGDLPLTDTEKVIRSDLVLNAFYNRMQVGDIVMSCFSNRTIDAIGVITGDPEWHNEYDNYKLLRKVKWLLKFEKEKYDIVAYNGNRSMTPPAVYKFGVLSSANALEILKEVNPVLFEKGKKPRNHVFIIDEINRGNISKIFGELITLIEPSKRLGAAEQMQATLPYSKQIFGVPDNVYIIGTMNSADRSIAMIDSALRRRFSFVEMQPKADLFMDINIETVSIQSMLKIINQRIEALLDRDHAIGHSFFLPLIIDQRIEVLADIFRKQIFPLLQEYFYDDYQKIQLVLGDNQKEDKTTCFIIEEPVKDLFGNNGQPEIPMKGSYRINTEAFKKPLAYEFMQ